jgi:hypothetical protein
MAKRDRYRRYWRLTAENAERFSKFKCGRNWYKFNLYDLSKLPALPCCYVIYGDHNIIYIGSTINLSKRFGTGGHKVKIKSVALNKRLIESFVCTWGEFDSLYIKVRFSDFLGDWAQKEIYLISRLRPKFNVTYNWGGHG